MHEKRIRLIHSLTGTYSTDFNYNYMFGQFSKICRNIKEREQEEEKKREEEKFIEFSPITDNTEHDGKNEDKKDEKERDKRKEEKEEEKDEWQGKEDQSEQNASNGYDYKSINEYIKNHGEEQLRRQKIPFGPEKQVEESNTHYSSFNEYMQNNKAVKLVTHLNEVSALSFRAANYLCPRRTGLSSRYLKRFNTYEHIMSKVFTRRQKKIIAMRRSVGFKSITSSRLMRKRSFTSLNVYAEKIRKIQFEPNKTLNISAQVLVKRRPSSVRSTKYCAAVYKACKEHILKTIEANGSNVEDFPISHSESEGDSDNVAMESINVLKVVHPKLCKIVNEDEYGTKCVDRYVRVFKMCTSQKHSSSSTSKDVVYKT